MEEVYGVSKKKRLYRGIKEPPRWYDPGLKAKFDALRAEAEKISDIREALIFAAQNDFDQLEQILQPKYFTDDEGIARVNAGKNGYLITIDVSGEVAALHYQTTKPIQGGVSMNFVFSPEELAENEKEWNLQVIEINKRRHEVKDAIERVYIEELQQRLKNLKPGDIIVSCSGTRRRVISVEGNNIELVSVKAGEVYIEILNKKTHFEDRGFDWVKDIELM